MKDLFRIMYIIVDKKGNGQLHTLSYQKKMCIDAFIKDSSMNWNQTKKHGSIMIWILNILILTYLFLNRNKKSNVKK